MAVKLKKRVKKKWVDALRSGKYQQGQRALSNEGKYCCLGVLCEVAIESGLPIQKEGHGVYVAYNGFDMYPPASVERWAFLKKSYEDAEFGLWQTARGSLANLNDIEKLSFAEIADIIEKEL